MNVMTSSKRKQRFVPPKFFIRVVKLIFTGGHISIMIALKGPVVTVWLPQRASCNRINHNHLLNFNAYKKVSVT